MPGEDAADQLREWLDNAQEDERLEVLQAISSGAYQLQPVSLAEGELTPLYEEAIAGVAAGGAATTRTAPGGGKQRRSPGPGSHRERPRTAVGGDGDADDDEMGADDVASGSTASGEAAKAQAGTGCGESPAATRRGGADISRWREGGSGTALRGA